MIKEEAKRDADKRQLHFSVCWDGICQTKFTTNIGHAKFFVPEEVNSVFVEVVPADPEMCPFAETVPLAGNERVSRHLDERLHELATVTRELSKWQR